MDNQTQIKLKRLREMLPNGFLKSLDPNLRLFCKGIKNNLREENYEIMGITGYAGCGKSMLAATMGCLIDENFTYNKNINFIPTAAQVEKNYLDLPMYSFLQVDEASRSVHKHKWYEKTQQKLATLYDTEREKHYICTALIMPRFQNFTENFRNFFIKYWINIINRGVAIVYRRDEDKDTKDPWNIENNYKLKQKYWKGKKVFERSVADIINMEKKTRNYWFYFTLPPIPEEIWQPYRELKAQSRIEMRDESKFEVENYKDKLNRLKMDRWYQVVKLRNEGKTFDEIAVILNKSLMTIKRDMKDIEIYNKYKEKDFGLLLNNDTLHNTNNNIYNLPNKDKFKINKAKDNKVPNVVPESEQWDINGLIKKN